MKNTNFSNIRKRDLILNPATYLWLEVEEEYSNINFDNLLNFIDENSDLGKENELGNAYYRIRQKSNKLFGVSKGSLRKLRTSKKEIRSIRETVIGRIDGRTYIKIPYKIVYIFKAIISIVEEIENDQGVSLPEELKSILNLTYGVAFYQNHISTYDAYYNDMVAVGREEWGYGLKLKLYNEFHAESSVFRTIVK